jgi:hypothetical protein
VAGGRGRGARTVAADGPWCRRPVPGLAYHTSSPSTLPTSTE